MHSSRDYEALQLFIQETNRRFNIMGKTVMDFSDLIKKNRDAIEALEEKIEELQFEDGNNKQVIKEIREDIDEIIADMEASTEERMGIDELENVLGDGSIAQAVQQANENTPELFQGDTSQTQKEEARPTFSPRPQTQPQTTSASQQPKKLDYENYKTNDAGFKYPRDKLVKMPWHKIRPLAINTFGCPEKTATRDYYVGWILKKQRDQAVAGGK